MDNVSRSRTTLRARGAGLVMLGAVTSVACAGAATSAPPAVVAGTVTDDDAMVSVKEYHRYHHHGGVTLFIALSLDTLGVAPEQQAAVEKIRRDLHQKMEPARVSEQGLVATLADGLAAGSVDPTKVDTALQQVAAAASAVHEASADALDQLHAVLTPPERAALVDKVEAHWAVWRSANEHEGAADAAIDGHLAALTADLGLTPDQVQKLRAGLGERMKPVAALDAQEVAGYVHAFGDAFRGEVFDARKLTSAPDVRIAGWGAAHLAHFVEAAVLVLNSDQRAALAQHLREHATHGTIELGPS